MNDPEIARSVPLRPLHDVARSLGLGEDDLEPYGRTMAKVRLDILHREERRTRGKYVVVTAITPTALEAGETVHAVGASMALNRIGHRSVCVVRQRSMGTVFGIEGGAAAVGRSRILPPEDFNLHLTGDFHAVSAANNLLAAMVDASLSLDNPLDLDPDAITWRRVQEIHDPALREIRLGLGGPRSGVPRTTGFDITGASEVMAVLGLAHDAKDLRERLGRMVVGSTRDGRPVSAEDLGAAGAMAVILRHALKPTLMQTSEGTPVLVHTGPSAEIAQGNSSIVADQVALRCADFVVTESGFGADLGAEKFFNIKCRTSGLRPDAALLVATVRALKVHSGRFRIVAGEPLPDELGREDLEAVREGAGNLARQIENVRLHGVPVVVAIDRFPSDTAAELELVRELARSAGAHAAHVSTWSWEGGAGGEDLANALVDAAEEPSTFRFLYPEDVPLREKIETIASRVYGARGVRYAPAAASRLDRFEKLGYGRMPICVAKTRYSLSHDPELAGRPDGFELLIEDARVAVGAGFVCPLAGAVVTMPGLGRSPNARDIDIGDDGWITGLT